MTTITETTNTAGENEAPVRAVDEGTEAPEEFDAGVNAGILAYPAST
jgi:hypothetical protein